MSPKPIVLVPACNKLIDNLEYNTVHKKYIDAVVFGANAIPLIIPPINEHAQWDVILKNVHGVLLTGSPSNVHPSLFNEAVANPKLPLDPERDQTTLPLIHAAIQRNIPILGICRGTQEINVALGGSLHQAIQTLEGKMDHREPKNVSLDEQYAPRHTIQISEGGKLHKLLGKSQSMVNSLHGQGVSQLGKGLTIEATAEDGIIEAFSIDTLSYFGLAFQWHPEWQIQQNPDSIKIFSAFGEACRAYARDHS